MRLNNRFLVAPAILFFTGAFAQKTNKDSLKTTSIGEVVVTAYGIKKENKKIGYSVQEIKGSETSKSRDANPLNAMVGKVAGLTIGANAEMLGRPDIILRGSKDLLYVVDGVPINSDTWNINPDDIESYTVLKGANAAALYGFRGENGAIVITTKKGSKKGWTVDVNSSTFIESGFIALPQSQTLYGRGKNYVYDYGDVLYDNKQRLPEWGPRFDGQLIRQYDSPYDPVTGKRTPTPWTARGIKNFENFVQTGIINTNNFAVSTSTDKADIRISVSEMNQRGVFPNTKLNTYNIALNGGISLSDKLRLDAYVNVNRQSTPNIPDVGYGPNSYIYMFKVYGSADYDINDLKDIYKGPMGVPGLMPYAQEYGRENSAWFMAKTWLRSHDKTDINSYIKATYKITPDLSATLRTQVTTWNQLRTEKVAAGTNLNDYTNWWYFGWYGDYREDRRNLFENNTDLIFNFNKKFDKINISALAGGAIRSFNYNSFWGTTKAMTAPGVYILSNTKDTSSSSFSWGSKMQVNSAFASFDASYDKYFSVSLTGRVDNVSTLPKGSNTFFYPSAALSTVVTDYANLPNFISFLKLRGSFAQVKGALTSSTVPSAYAMATGKSTNSLLGYGTDLYTIYDGPNYQNQNAYVGQTYYNGTPSVSYTTNSLANPNVQPFTRTSYEYGFDSKFFRNRIGLDFTYFTSLNGPLIYALPIASSTGYTNIMENAITTKKTGIELTLNAAIFKNPDAFSWNLAFNYSTYKERLYKVYGDVNSILLNGHNYSVGDRLDAYYDKGFVRDGSGNIVYDKGLPIAPPSDNGNKTFLGYMNPDFTFGINNKFSYKNITLTVQFDGRIGGKIYDQVYANGTNGGTSLESASGALGDARAKEWELVKAGNKLVGQYIGQGVKITKGTPKFKDGKIINLDELTFAPNDEVSTVQNFISGGIYKFPEYWMMDRSFVKLREVSLTYSLPKSVLSKWKYISAASISLTGRNLLYWAQRRDIDLDQYASGYYDKEQSLGTGAALQSPTLRRFGININLTF